MTMPDLVVLCGGMGLRLRPLISDVPKPMAPVAGRPFLEIILSYFRDLGFENAILSTGHMASVVSDHFGETFRGLNLRYCVDPEPLGTGGAARAAAEFCTTDAVVVCNGDTFVECDFAKALSLWDETRSPVVFTLHVPDTERYGRIDLGARSEARFAGRGHAGAGFISGGVYVMPRNWFSKDTRPAPFSLEEFLFDGQRSERIYAVETRGRFIDIGIPSSYAAAQQMFTSK